VNWNHWIRQAHRWLSILFALTVIAAFIAMAQKTPVVWVSYLPLPPLLLMLVSGLYLFALPYAARRRSQAGG
jgi:predicted Na+-dependent transporter